MSFTVFSLLAKVHLAGAKKEVLLATSSTLYAKNGSSHMFLSM